MNTPASTASAITDEQIKAAAERYITTAWVGARQWPMVGQYVEFARAVLALSAPTAQPVGQAEGEPDPCDALRDKLESVIDYATGGKLSQSGWALSTIKAAIDEHVNAAVEPSQPAQYVNDLMYRIIEAGFLPEQPDYDADIARAKVVADWIASTPPAPAAPSIDLSDEGPIWRAIWEWHKSANSLDTGRLSEKAVNVDSAISAALAASTKGTDL